MTWRFILFLAAWFVVALILFAAIAQVPPYKFNIPLGATLAAVGMGVMLWLSLRNLED